MVNKAHLFENLLEATLGRAVTTVERDGLPVLISNDLDLNVPGTGTELHEEDGRTHHLICHL